MRFIFSFLLLFSVLCCPGCGKPKPDPNRTLISGSVVFKGTPLRAGMITLTSEDSPERRMSCIIRPDGTFSVENAPKGKVLVGIDTRTFSPEIGGSAELYQKIPVRYADPATSGLSLEIPPGGLKDHVFTLTE